MSNSILKNDMIEAVSYYNKAANIADVDSDPSPSLDIANITAIYHKFSTVKGSLIKVYGDTRRIGGHISKTLPIITKNIKFMDDVNKDTVIVDFDRMMDVIDALFMSEFYGPSCNYRTTEPYSVLSKWLDDLKYVVICKRNNGFNNGRYVLIPVDHAPVDKGRNNIIDKAVSMTIDGVDWNVFGYISISIFIDDLKSRKVEHSTAAGYGLDNVSVWDIFKYIFMEFAMEKYYNSLLNLKDYVSRVQVYYLNHADNNSLGVIPTYTQNLFHISLPGWLRQRRAIVVSKSPVILNGNQDLWRGGVI